MAEEIRRKQWQVPAYGSSKKEDVRQFLKQNVDDGIEFLECSPGYQQLEESIRILSGRPEEELKQKQDKLGYSKVQTNRLKRNLREMVNSLSEIRYNPGYHSSSKDTFDFANTINKVGEWWYTDTFADVKIKKALQWAAISPCGWLEICYRELPGRRGERVIDLIPMSWFDVVMTGVTDDGDHQAAYTVTIIKDLPVYLAHALWPDHQKVLTPDRESPKGWIERVKDKAKQVIKDVFENEPEKQTAKNPTVRLYYQYVLDLAINKGKETMKMGYDKKPVKQEDGTYKEELQSTPWSYEVPYVGQMIPGYDRQGNRALRPAEPKECRIFPGRRLLVGTDKELIYDGPMFDWHGQVPLIKFCFDSWVFGEFSAVHDVSPIHETVNEIDRVSHQTLRNRFNPTMGYNTRAVTIGQAKSVRLDVQGDRVGFNGQEATDINKAMGPLVPHNFNIIEGWVSELRKYLDDTMDYQMGVRNFEALAKLKLGAGGGGDIDKILEAAGPIVKGISRDMERQMRDLADMFKYDVVQYLTSAMLMPILGPDQMAPVNFDYDPGNLIPSHLPGEDKQQKSVYSDMQRARWMCDHTSFVIMPGTLHEIIQTAHKMMIIQVWRQGFPVSWWTINETLRLGLNLGPKPGKTELDAWVEQQKMMGEIKKELEGEAGGNTPNAGPRGGQRKTGGRAPTGNSSPQFAQKDGGSRQTVKESQ